MCGINVRVGKIFLMSAVWWSPLSQMLREKTGPPCDVALLLRDENGPQAEMDPTRMDRTRRSDCILLENKNRDMMTIVVLTILRRSLGE